MRLPSRILVGCIALLGLSLTAQPAKAGFTYGFNAVANNGTNVNTATSGQYSVEVSSVAGLGTNGGALVDFTFRNIGSAQSTIAQIFFDDGTLLGISTVINGSAVNFLPGSPNPGEQLKGGNTLSPAFVTTAGFLADAVNPDPHNGVQNVPNLASVGGEFVTIRFELINGKTYANTIAAIEGGLDLRIGINVINFANGGSEGFVNDDTPGDGGGPGGGDSGHAVPAPAGLILLATAIPVLGLRRVLRRKTLVA